MLSLKKNKSLKRKSKKNIIKRSRDKHDNWFLNRRNTSRSIAKGSNYNSFFNNNWFKHPKPVQKPRRDKYVPQSPRQVPPHLNYDHKYDYDYDYDLKPQRMVIRIKHDNTHEIGPEHLDAYQTEESDNEHRRFLVDKLENDNILTKRHQFTLFEIHDWSDGNEKYKDYENAWTIVADRHNGDKVSLQNINGKTIIPSISFGKIKQKVDKPINDGRRKRSKKRSKKRYLK